MKNKEINHSAGRLGSARNVSRKDPRSPKQHFCARIRSAKNLVLRNGEVAL
jgi:hypothetical protein